MATIGRKTTKDRDKWQTRVRLSNHDPITRIFFCKTHASQWAKETEIRIEKGLISSRYEKTNDTLREVIKRYLSEITPNKKGEQVEEIKIKKLMRDLIASKKFGYLKPHHLIKYRNKRLQEVSASTVKKELNLLSHVFETAIKEWEMALIGNPLRQVSKPKENPPRDRRLEIGEEKLLLEGYSQSTNPYLNIW
ncbi:MAG: capsid protein p24 [Pseudomonadota bacterium]|nr:capsid protein p24 [Pseudomonadota bacterium]